MKIESAQDMSVEQSHPKGKVEKLIVDRIYRAVMEQRLSPNTKLSESKLCETFGVGRMHVRRALLLLSSEGLIDLQSNRGAYVASPNQKDANDVFEARLIIEPSLVRNLVDDINHEALDDLSKHITLENKARDKNQRTDLIRLSGEFHVKLALASGNPIITKTVRELVTKTSLIVGLFGSAPHFACPDDEHLKILTAIKDKNPAEAEQLLITHLKHIWQGLNVTGYASSQNDLADILGGSL